MPFNHLVISICLQILLPCVLLGNDGAAEIALGGIRLKQERRVAMIKERLFISKKRVRVEYEFLNESKQVVTTEVAFPLPEFQCDVLMRPLMKHVHGDDWKEEINVPFKLWVDGKETPFKTEIRANVGGRDITPLLDDCGIRIDTFGDYREGETRIDGDTPATSQMDRLSQSQLDQLIEAGAIDPSPSTPPSRNAPRWTVKKTLHWEQCFPPGKVLKVAHEYLPHLGSATDFYIEDLVKPSETSHNLFADPACPDENWIREVRKAIREREAKQPAHISYVRTSVFGRWVRYILTTANTWKTPIRDFELIVERDPGEFITFCWDGPVEKIGANTFRARVKDFIPVKELTVYFLQP